MAYLCISEQGAFLGISGNRFTVKSKGEVIKSVPAEVVDVIEIFGNVQVSTQCLTKCLRSGIDVIYLSMNGSYQGRLISLSHANSIKQRKQLCYSNDRDFSLTISKNIIAAKISNQIAILRRYGRNRNTDLSAGFRNMRLAEKAVMKCSVISQILGHEGYAAKEYFKYLGGLTDPQFAFNGRTRRPPRDPFNSLISFGYTLLFNEIIGIIELKNLNPFWGFIHHDHLKHQSLASDLMEEWRAVIVDSLAMSCLNGHEIVMSNFRQNENNQGIYLNQEGIRLFLSKFENKMNTKSRYLDFIDYAISFRKAIEYQIERLIKAIDRNSPEYYIPVRIR
ncbi:CRISPR-associated endonuclease Cas1 [Succinimonas amylolytica]|uniref:CRISPR-associated endonuclease Cas1 n=1 Tax=Succinimonas amylolytica TaxID=83769 RepID=UPI00036225CB|nr:CRISPR-associated endonuclease Cas1 [Succinimonas amylolytica]